MKSDAAARSAKLDGQSYVIIRQAGETGQLYGSVSARDIAEVIAAAAKFPVHHNHVALDQPIKNLGLHKVTVHLHPEVEAHVTINVARSPEQAERQAQGRGSHGARADHRWTISASRSAARWRKPAPARASARD